MDIRSMSDQEVIRYAESFSDVPADLVVCNKIFSRAVTKMSGLKYGSQHVIKEFVDRDSSISFGDRCSIMPTPCYFSQVYMNKGFRLCPNPPCEASMVQILAHAYSHLESNGYIGNQGFVNCGNSLRGEDAYDAVKTFVKSYANFMRMFLENFACEEYAGCLLSHSFLAKFGKTTCAEGA